MRECINYKKIDTKTLECRTCSHFCKIAEGRTGICGIRQNLKGKLYLLAYGKAIAAHIDPVEKKPLFHFLPRTLAYSVGTIGCNFRCGNCQNFDISQMYGLKGKVEEYKKLEWGIDLPPEKIACGEENVEKYPTGVPSLKGVYEMAVKLFNARCTNCGGDGRIYIVDRVVQGQDYGPETEGHYEDCPQCGGSGVLLQKEGG